VRSAFPVTAGGLRWEKLADALQFYGPDTIFLMGGALYEAGPRLKERSKAFVEQIHRLAKEGVGVHAGSL
jgi:ribulose-bisphosphate carboxylase large chain